MGIGFAKEGDYVFCNNFRIKLVMAIGNGEEGIIYKTDTPFVCKIYKWDSLEYLKYKKILLMLKMKVNDNGICWPLALVYNNKNQFVGYIMIRAYGRELKEALFNKKYLFANFPNWRKRDTVQLAITILKKIKYLHDRDIILGDINTENILVVSSSEVYFVDTDSYQINGIPCPVGTEIFTAPEIRESVYRNFLRSYGNEYFAVATLVFMIMLMGAAPYEGEKSIEIMQNIKNMNFKYKLNYWGSNRKVSKQSIFLWSHLPYFLRKAFYSTFKYGENRSDEFSRYTTEDWIVLLEKYLYQLDSGIIGKGDYMSEELFPTRLKI